MFTAEFNVSLNTFSNTSSVLKCQNVVILLWGWPSSDINALSQLCFGRGFLLGWRQTRAERERPEEQTLTVSQKLLSEVCVCGCVDRASHHLWVCQANFPPLDQWTFTTSTSLPRKKRL